MFTVSVSFSKVTRAKHLGRHLIYHWKKVSYVHIEDSTLSINTFEMMINPLDQEEISIPSSM